MRGGAFRAALAGAALAAIAGLAACAGEEEASAPPGGCDVAVQNAVAFSTAEPTDLIEGRAFGPSCRNAVMALTVRDAAGAPIWAFAAPFATFSYELREGVEIPRPEIEERLASWVNVLLDDTGALPPWPAEQPSLAQATGDGDFTPLAQAEYEALRAAKRPRLCYDASIERIECVARDEAQEGRVRLIYRSGGL